MASGVEVPQKAGLVGTSESDEREAAGGRKGSGSARLQRHKPPKKREGSFVTDLKRKGKNDAQMNAEIYTKFNAEKNGMSRRSRRSRSTRVR